MITYEQAIDLKKGDIVYWKRVQFGGTRYLRAKVLRTYAYKRKDAVKIHVFGYDLMVEKKGNASLFLERPVTPDAIEEPSPLQPHPAHIAPGKMDKRPLPDGYRYDASGRIIYASGPNEGRFASKREVWGKDE